MRLFLLLFLQSSLLLDNVAYGQLDSLKSKIGIEQAITLPMAVGQKDTLMNVYIISFHLPDSGWLYLVKYGYIGGECQLRLVSGENSFVFKRDENSLDSFVVRVNDIGKGQAGSPFMDYPAKSEWPNEFSRFEIKDLRQFQSKLNRVLNIHFPAGTWPTSENNVTTIISPYSQLKIDDEGLIGEISILISQPVVEGGMIFYRTAYLSREHRGMSPKPRSPGKKVQDAAKKFFADFLNEVNN